MTDPAERLATYEDLFERPEDEPAEVIAGSIVSLPSPTPAHNNVQGVMHRSIGGPFHGDGDQGGPGGWWIFSEVDVRFTVHDVVRPDMSGWRHERLPDPWLERPIDVAPDWICEVLSPSNIRHDRVTKRRLYAEHGVAHYWIVDVSARVLEAFSLVEGRWVEAGVYGDEVAMIPPFEEIELDIARLFPPA